MRIAWVFSHVLNTTQMSSLGDKNMKKKITQFLDMVGADNENETAAAK